MQLAELNTELFRMIDRQITDRPESHDQGTWVGTGACGTTRCIAGWALHFTDPDRDVSVTARRIIRENNIPLPTPDVIGTAARLVLGLSPSEADALFYSPESRSAELVRQYANGVRP